MTRLGNLYRLPPLPLTEEHIDILAEGSALRVERIVSTGQTTDWQSAAETELVTLLQGRAAIQFDGGGEETLETGDSLLIHPHERHRVSRTSHEPPCVWLCVFFG